MILYQLFTGVVPFSNCKLFEIPNKVLAGEKPPISMELDCTIRDLIYGCLDKKPTNRPNCSSITTVLLSYLRQVQPKNKKK